MKSRIVSKLEVLSHFVYSALSLFGNDKAIKDINTIFFIWKNRPYKLKIEVFLPPLDFSLTLP